MKQICSISVFVFLTVGLAGFSKDTALPLFEITYESDMIILQPTSEYGAITVAVAGPAGLAYNLDFSTGETPFLGITDAGGNLLPNGLYTYQLTAAPLMDASQQRALNQARRDQIVPQELPRGNTKSGSFRMLDGEIVLPTRDTEQTTKTDQELSQAIDADAGRDQVFTDDVIVDGSLCAGFDCVNGEVFGFDTLRLKENNLRLHFDDTSTGTYPSNDWRIVANASTNGGQSYLGFEDATAGRTVFLVESGAPSNALYVDDGGRVGLGTSTPSVDLHVKSGNSPTLRLEQDGSSGFAPQTWDLAGNETNFFVRDVSGGSTLPLRIRPGAPSTSIFVDVDGDVGLGDASPDAALDVESGNLMVTNGQLIATSGDTTLTSGDGVSGQLLVENSNATASSRVLMELSNKGSVSMIYRNTSGPRWGIGVDNQGFAASDNTSGSAAIKVRNTGETIITNDSSTNTLTLSDCGDLTVTGLVSGAGVSCSSDVNLKENFQEVLPMDVLAKVINMPVTTWNFIADAGDTRHIGPMAQDFYGAFGLGEDERHISPMDSAAVALTSIKALNTLVEEKDAQIDEMGKKLEAQEARLQALEKLLLK